MSKIRANKLEHISTSNGGVELDNAGHVTVDGLQMPTSGPLGNRNLIINGDMRVAQRGTGNFAIGDDSYPVDRFLFSNSGSGFTGGANGFQSTTAPAGFKNSLEVDITTADVSLTSDSQAKIEYRVEGYDAAHLNWGTANAQTVTLSFYIKSNLTGESAVAFVNQNNNRSYVATFNINTADTWERKEITVPGPTDGDWVTHHNIGLRLRWGSFGNDFQTTSTNQWISTQKMTSTSSINFFNSTDNNLFLTGVQLEIGEKATPFEHRSYGDELARCQRYYQRASASSGSAYARCIPLGHMATNNILRVVVPLHPPMRVQPTFNFSGSFATQPNVGTPGLSLETSNSAGGESVTLVDSSSISGTVGNCISIAASNDDDAYMEFRAEL